MTFGHQAITAAQQAMFQLKSWQGIYGRIQADIDASHRWHSSTPLTRGGLAHCWLTLNNPDYSYGDKPVITTMGVLFTKSVSYGRGDVLKIKQRYPDIHIMGVFAVDNADKSPSLTGLDPKNIEIVAKQLLKSIMTTGHTRTKIIKNGRGHTHDWASPLTVYLMESGAFRIRLYLSFR